MKVCTVCGVPKTLDAFHRNRRATDGRASQCSECKKGIDAKSHARHADQRRAKRGNDRRAVADWLKTLKERQSCQDCKLPYPSYVLQWDHLDGTTKRFNLSECRTWSKATILAEISQCELVCANCHAVRTHVRRHGATGSTPHS